MGRFILDLLLNVVIHLTVGTLSINSKIVYIAALITAASYPSQLYLVGMVFINNCYSINHVQPGLLRPE